VAVTVEVEKAEEMAKEMAAVTAVERAEDSAAGKEAAMEAEEEEEMWYRKSIRKDEILSYDYPQHQCTHSQLL